MYQNLMSNKPLSLVYAAALVAAIVQKMTAAPGSLTSYLASIVFTALFGVTFILQGSLKSWYGRYILFWGLLLLILDGLLLADWLLSK